MEHEEGKTKRWYEYRAVDGRQRKLSPQAIQIIKNYVDPESPTYGNARRSYEMVRPEHTNEASMVRCSQTFMANPNVKNAIEHLLEENGFGIQQRIKTLADIGTGRAVMEKEEVTKDGEVVVVQVQPTFSERMKAVEIANKVDGTYAKLEAAREIAVDEHKRLQHKLVSDLANKKK